MDTKRFGNLLMLARSGVELDVEQIAEIVMLRDAYEAETGVHYGLPESVEPISVRHEYSR